MSSVSHVSRGWLALCPPCGCGQPRDAWSQLTSKTKGQDYLLPLKQHRGQRSSYRQVTNSSTIPSWDLIFRFRHLKTGYFNDVCKIMKYSTHTAEYMECKKVQRKKHKVNTSGVPVQVKMSQYKMTSRPCHCTPCVPTTGKITILSRVFVSPFCSFTL